MKRIGLVMDRLGLTLHPAKTRLEVTVQPACLAELLQDADSGGVPPPLAHDEALDYCSITGGQSGTPSGQETSRGGPLSMEGGRLRDPVLFCKQLAGEVAPYARRLTHSSFMPRPASFVCGLLLVVLVIPAQVEPQQTIQERPKPIESLQYGVEWRLVRAGRATLSRTERGGNGWLGELQLESTGLVSRLYRVNVKHQSMFDPGFCVSETHLQAEEGRRRRETTVTFHKDAKKSTYLERDLIKNTIVMEKELDTPECVHDIVAALVRLRAMKLPPGQSAQLPMSDGKRMVFAHVDAQEKEMVKTPAGTFAAVRYEAFLFNDVLFKRKGRLYLWLTDDEQRLPVQIRVKLGFPVGTISLQLEQSGTI